MNTRPVTRTVAAVVTISLIIGCAGMRPIGPPPVVDDLPCQPIHEFEPSEVLAEMIHYQDPVYPRLAEQAGLEGVVWLEVLVGKRGGVKEAAVFKSSGTPALDDAALKAAPKCRFNPAIQNGEPICVWVTYKVEFTLGSQ